MMIGKHLDKINKQKDRKAHLKEEKKRCYFCVLIQMQL
jgi:hypothetical protein